MADELRTLSSSSVLSKQAGDLEEEEEEFYFHVPSPIELIGCNIHHMPKVLEGVTCP